MLVNSHSKASGQFGAGRLSRSTAFPRMSEAGVTDSARAAQTVKLPSDCRRRDRPRRRRGLLPLRGEDRRPGRGPGLTSAELGSKLDPVLVLTDANGAVLAEGTAAARLRCLPSGNLRHRRPRPRVSRRRGLHATASTSATCRSSRACSRWPFRAANADVHVEGVNLGAAARARVDRPG